MNEPTGTILTDAGAAPRPPKRRFVDIAKTAIQTVATAWLIASAILFAYQRWVVFPTYMVPMADDWTWPGVKRVAVRTADGETLRGYWRPPAPGAGVVVTFHGNGSMPEPHAARFASGPWLRNGWGVLAVAFRGYPGSTGSPSEEGILADGEAATAFVRSEAPGAAVLFHGHSLGTGVAVAQAARHPSKGLYLEAAYSSLSAVARYRAPYMPTFLLWDTMRSEDRIAPVSAPILMVHGDADPLIPPAIGRRLAAAASRPVDFLEIPGDHMSLLGERDDLAEATFRNAAPSPPTNAR